VLPTHHLVAFLLTVYVVILIPGPSVLFTVSRGLALGRRAALATVAGNSAGFACQLVLVAVGLGVLIARSDAVFEVLRLLGAAYLVALGVRKIRDRKALGAAFDAGASGPRSLRRTAREGFVVGATNPKGILIFTAILPQFIDRSSASQRDRRRDADRPRRRPRGDRAAELTGAKRSGRAGCRGSAASCG
jgi:threonine/homoserine/homoserine lactone efflux protein